MRKPDRRPVPAYRDLRPRGVHDTEDGASAGRRRPEKRAVAGRDDQTRQAEEALRRVAEFIRILLESMEEAVVACDPAVRLVLLNAAARRWHGLGATEPFTEHWSDRLSLLEADGVTPLPSDRVPLIRALRGETIRGVAMAIVLGDDPPRHVLVSGGPIREAEGRSSWPSWFGTT